MLKFHDGITIHGNTAFGGMMYITFRQCEGYPERIIPLSRAAAIIQARSILQQLAPKMLIEPDRAVVPSDLIEPAVVVDFQTRRVVDFLGRAT